MAEMFSRLPPLCGGLDPYEWSWLTTFRSSVFPTPAKLKKRKGITDPWEPQFQCRLTQVALEERDMLLSYLARPPVFHRPMPTLQHPKTHTLSGSGAPKLATIKFFAWLLVLGKLNCRSYRYRRNICTVDESYCALCPSVAAVTPGSWAGSYHFHHQCNMTQYFSAKCHDLQPGATFAEKSSAACVPAPLILDLSILNPSPLDSIVHSTIRARRSRSADLPMDPPPALNAHPWQTPPTGLFAFLKHDVVMPTRNDEIFLLLLALTIILTKASSGMSTASPGLAATTSSSCHAIAVPPSSSSSSLPAVPAPHGHRNHNLHIYILCRRLDMSIEEKKHGEKKKGKTQAAGAAPSSAWKMCLSAGAD
ncbi:hypothetical protein HU200_066177 [Digitaria exilis]|uniref:Uncharacterized protein n=1 Tax=Digitaria exilis TaxID=1010633 RepID=A0A835DT43_9POAL|nr:hypothetical protein HU200_066177 [Digitaria exilis]